MCLLCIETAKESLTGKEFLRNYLETSMEETDEQHYKEFAEIVANTSQEFKDEVAKAVSRSLLEEGIKK